LCPTERTSACGLRPACPTDDGMKKLRTFKFSSLKFQILNFLT
jgi:hypothetical protein